MNDKKTNMTKDTSSKRTRNTKQRVGSEQSATRALILNATEKLMLNEGYASVSSRRVAKEIEVKPSLIHYYFPTTDDLLLAVFRRAVEETVEKQDDAFATDTPLNKLWNNFLDPDRTAIALEFMALANHREAIKKEIADYTQRTRQRRAELLAKAYDFDLKNSDQLSPAGLNVLLLSVARTLVMEHSLGISTGHEDVKVYIEALIKRLESTPPN